MKFLLIVKPRQSTVLPPAAVASMLSAQRAWLQDRRADGTFDCSYGFPLGGGCGIVNVDSHEALNELMLAAPSFVINDFEAHALCDVDVALGNVVKMLEGVAAGS